MDELEALKIVCKWADEAVSHAVFENEEYGEHIDEAFQAIDLVEKVIEERSKKCVSKDIPDAIKNALSLANKMSEKR